MNLVVKEEYFRWNSIGGPDRKTLYITTRPALYSLRMRVAGNTKSRYQTPPATVK